MDIVTKAFLNPENILFWNTDLEKFEVINRNPGEVGSIAHLHYLQKGRRYIMQDKLVYVDPGKRYVSEVSGDVLVVQVETAFNPCGNGTEMNVAWLGKGKILFLKLLQPLLRIKIIHQAKMELEIFKKLVELKGVNFNAAP